MSRAEMCIWPVRRVLPRCGADELLVPGLHIWRIFWRRVRRRNFLGAGLEAMARVGASFEGRPTAWRLSARQGAFAG